MLDTRADRSASRDTVPAAGRGPGVAPKPAGLRGERAQWRQRLSR